MRILEKIKDFFLKDKRTRHYEKNMLEIEKLQDEWRKDWIKLSQRYNFDPVKEEKLFTNSFVKIMKKDLQIKKNGKSSKKR